MYTANESCSLNWLETCPLITYKGPVVKTFLRLFEEYPQSQEFFSDFRGTPLEALKDDHKLSTILQEHAIRVLRVVEKVIGRIEDLEKVYLKITKNEY